MVERIDVSNNFKNANFTVKVVNDGTHDSSMTWSLQLFKVLEKAFLSVVIKVQEHKDDKTCEKDFYRTTIDLKKLFGGGKGSFVAKIFMENFFATIDFDAKFPFKQVRKFIKVN